MNAPSGSPWLDAGVSLDWKRLPRQVDSLDGIAADATELSFRRTTTNYRGLSRLTELKLLSASRVDQKFLDEIVRLPALETLSIKLMSAVSAEPLTKLRRLKRLMIRGGGKVENLDWVRRLPPGIEAICLEGFWRCHDLAPLADMPGLTGLALEGGIDRRYEVDTLEPLATLPGLRALFLPATKVRNDGLAPLGRIRTLRHLSCGAYFPDAEFLALRRALPDLDCSWIDEIEKHGSLKAAMKAINARIRGQ